MEKQEQIIEFVAMSKKITQKEIEDFITSSIILKEITHFINRKYRN